MERYNDPAPRTPSPSTSPRRGILRQPTLTMSDFAPFTSDEDFSQLSDVFRTLLMFLRDQTTEEEAATAVRNLQGHQDLKDMFPENMDLVPTLRRIVEMLESIENKIDAMEDDPISALTMSPIPQTEVIEQAPQEPTPSDDERAELTTDSETESEIESDSDDEPAPPRLNRRLIFTSSDEDSDDELEDLALRF